ncbi:component of gems protein 1-like [Bombina bombina]|uniref:component of gems protein 1-like n=1 Tax=Bombina bombina TaxID=8345 RepID=UPI00235B2585|nr:component of gems protein 1-like [Bombina bombina]
MRLIIEFKTSLIAKLDDEIKDDEVLLTNLDSTESESKEITERRDTLIKRVTKTREDVIQKKMKKLNRELDLKKSIDDNIAQAIDSPDKEEVEIIQHTTDKRPNDGDEDTNGAWIEVNHKKKKRQEDHYKPMNEHYRTQRPQNYSQRRPSNSHYPHRRNFSYNRNYGHTQYEIDQRPYRDYDNHGYHERKPRYHNRRQHDYPYRENEPRYGNNRSNYGQPRPQTYNYRQPYYYQDYRRSPPPPRATYGRDLPPVEQGRDRPTYMGNTRPPTNHREYNHYTYNGYRKQSWREYPPYNQNTSKHVRLLSDQRHHHNLEMGQPKQTPQNQKTKVGHDNGQTSD